MARARNIKPGFFRDAALVELPVETRLLFPGLWTIADREGRLEDKPKQIKMEIYPADSFDVETMLCQLSDAGLILRYEAQGKRYIQIKNFGKHQNPHRDEKASTIPAPCEHGASTVQALGEHDGNRADSLNLIPEEKPIVRFSEEAKRVIDHLNGKTGSRFRHVPANLDIVRARLDEGFTVGDCMAVIDAKSAEWSGNADMEKYLRPETLFARKKFASYSGQIGSVGVKDWE